RNSGSNHNAAPRSRPGHRPRCRLGLLRFLLQLSSAERAFMKLTDRLTEYVHAACSGLWVHTAEPDEAEREIVRLAQERKWKIAVWDIAQGLRLPGSSSAV